MEIVISLSLFAVAIVGFLQIFNTALDSHYRATQEIITTNLARGLMAEIMSKNFVEPGSADPPPALGPDPGELDRNDFDDVDDYHGFSESPPYTVGALPMDGTGATANYSDFTRSVTVEYLDENLQPDPGATDYKKVTVTVSGPYVRDISLVEVKVRQPE